MVFKDKIIYVEQAKKNKYVFYWEDTKDNEELAKFFIMRLDCIAKELLGSYVDWENACFVSMVGRKLTERWLKSQFNKDNVVFIN